MTYNTSFVLDTGRSGHILLVTLVVISYVITFASGYATLTPFETTLILALGIIYLLLAAFGDRICHRQGRLVFSLGYLALLTLIGATILYLSGGQAWLIMLPVLGQGIELLPRPWAAIACTLNLIVVAGVTMLLLSRMPGLPRPLWQLTLQSISQYALAYAFVILFTQVAVRERAVRAEVERLAAELGNANAQLREYAAQAEELATVKERNRLAREIHDGLGHYLTAIHMQIQAGRAVLDHDRDKALDAMDKAQALAQQGLFEVRRSVAALRASPLDRRPLSEAILELVDECRAVGIATDYHLLGEAQPLAPQIGLALYRAAQEGLTNIRKHADASSAEVLLDYQDDALIKLTIQDYGLGAQDTQGGYGLMGIRERIGLLGGAVCVETAPGKGFRLEVEVPR
ncbi:MAG: sensor histidine kinase [Anaerolineae bacterium]|nr:sensor histidine kinase [Anaerolineae bacterium]